MRLYRKPTLYRRRYRSPTMSFLSVAVLVVNVIVLRSCLCDRVDSTPKPAPAAAQNTDSSRSGGSTVSSQVSQPKLPR